MHAPLTLYHLSSLCKKNLGMPGEEDKMTESQIIAKHQRLQKECEDIVRKVSELEFELNEHR
jgi:hypothetical protein